MIEALREAVPGVARLRSGGDLNRLPGAKDATDQEDGETASQGLLACFSVSRAESAA